MKTGARKDGTLVAREASILFDGGAYADESPTVLSFAVLMARGPYRIPHLRSRGLVVYTNKLKASAFRGFGNPAGDLSPARARSTASPNSSAFIPSSCAC